MTFVYRPQVLDELAGHGLRPLPTSRPAFVLRCLQDLYRYELRALRSRLARGDFPRSEYAARVVALRHAYPLVSLHPQYWTEPGTPAESADVPLC